jgi:hypothetical protein
MKHKKYILLFLVFASSTNVGAQDYPFVFEDTINDQSMIRITSFNHYGSNRFNNALTDKFLFGGEITQEIKDDNEARLKSLNSIGGEFEQRIDSYSPDVNPFNKDKYGLVMSFSDNHFISANIPGDLYRTALYGNADYAGDTMDFSFGHAQYQHYQKLSVGFYEKKTLSSVQVSFITGSKSANFHTANSSLLSHADGDTVELKLQGQGFATSEFNPYWAFQGTGFCFDLNYNFMFMSKDGNRQLVNLRINNLGAIFWNKSSFNYYADSTTTYTGFDIHNFIDDDTLNNNYNFPDTLGLIKTIGRYTDVLPLELVVEKLADRFSPNKVQVIFGFKGVLTPDYRPYLFAGAYFQPVTKFSASSHLSYGGFAGFRWGLNFNYWPSDQLYFSLGSVDMIGNISKKYGFGRSLNFSAYFKL